MKITSVAEVVAAKCDDRGRRPDEAILGEELGLDVTEGGPLQEAEHGGPRHSAHPELGSQLSAYAHERRHGQVLQGHVHDLAE